MRKQYHFRPSERGLLAWDVDRLIAMSKDFPRVQVPLTAIRELDEPVWFGFGDTPTCRVVVEHARLIEAVDLGLPMILSSDGRVMDGMHRVAKAVLLGRPAIVAVRFTDDPDPDFVNVNPNELPYEETPSHPTNVASTPSAAARIDPRVRWNFPGLCSRPDIPIQQVSSSLQPWLASDFETTNSHAISCVQP